VGLYQEGHDFVKGLKVVQVLCCKNSCFDDWKLAFPWSVTCCYWRRSTEENLDIRLQI